MASAPESLNTARSTAGALPSLAWFYALWTGIAAIAALTGMAPLHGGTIVLLTGIAITNAFFLGTERGQAGPLPQREEFALAQCILGIAWSSAYLYFSDGGSELALGMFITVLLFAVFHLDIRVYLRLCVGAAGGYALALLLKIILAPVIVEPARAALGLTGLLALLALSMVLSRRLRDLRNNLQDRNEELQSIITKVTRIAERDDLTKSFNRRYIMETLRREAARAARSGKPFSVVMFDLDHFKRVNDSYGHLVGDQILKAFSRRVIGELRGMDTVNPTSDEHHAFGRFGGEEFLAILPATDLRGGLRCAERIRDAVAERPFANIYAVTVSAGVAEFRPGESVPDLLARADAALYRAKNAGRNKVCLSDGAQHQDSGGTVPNLRILR